MGPRASGNRGAGGRTRPGPGRETTAPYCRSELSGGGCTTPLLEEQLASPQQGKAVRRFPVPVGGFGDADQLAQWVCFMLSGVADSFAAV